MASIAPEESMPKLEFLSKTRFMSGQQCLLKLWNYYFCPDLGSDPDADTLARMMEGHEVGELARQRYPGILVDEDRDHLEAAVETTSRLVQDPSIMAIHEGTFVFEGALVRVDVLNRTESGAWDLIEVKSCLEVEEEHRIDASFQRWVLGQAGIPVERTYVMVPDREYCYQGGAYDLEAFFRMVDVTAFAERKAPFIESEVGRFLDMLQQPKAPAVSLSSHCYKPYPCPYLGECTSHWPKATTPIEWLHGVGPIRSMELHAEGIHGMLDIPKTRLSENQTLLRNCHESGQPWISPDLAKALNVFEYPIHFLDFESTASAVPKLVGSHPHEAMPFQWSCHTLHEDGRLTHTEYLADDNAYPRETLFKGLLEVLGTKGSICVYSPFEKRMLNEAIRAMPHREWDLQGLIKRLVDLLPIVKRHLYLPAF
jgi:hypothetical protein